MNQPVVSMQTYELELMQYAAGEATFEAQRIHSYGVSVVLPLADWDNLGRPEVIRVSIEVAS